MAVKMKIEKTLEYWAHQVAGIEVSDILMVTDLSINIQNYIKFFL